MSTEVNSIEFHLCVPENLHGQRLDKALATLIPEYSRSRLKYWIQQGWVRVNQQPLTQIRHRIQGGECIDIDGIEASPMSLLANDVPFEVVFADASLIVINKPAGVVVHPAPGYPNNTLINGLINIFPDLKELPRAGLIHRLDKDTSGLLLVARTLAAHNKLVSAMQLRQIKREYIALVYGKVIAGGTIDIPIGRHPHLRTHMAVVKHGKTAVTHYRILERFEDFTLLSIQLETGRTHQIRVHLTHIHHPIVGDPVYGKMRLPQHQYTQDFLAHMHTLRRQALHACRLSFMHPILGTLIEIQCDLPAEIATLIQLLQQHEKKDVQ